MIERDKIVIAGRVNTGKSSLMNLLTRQETSITDPRAGTTADTSRTFIEFHGLGPVALFDTAGIDEEGGLGAKKKKKVLDLIKESDLILLLINPRQEDFSAEKALIQYIRVQEKQLLIIYNIFHSSDKERIADIEKNIPDLKFHKKIKMSAVNESDRRPLEEFILKNYSSSLRPRPLLPFLKPDLFYPFIIPMDGESPEGRLIRPQSVLLEYILRNGGFVAAYRPGFIADLKEKKLVPESELDRADKFFKSFSEIGCVICDSQVVDYADKVIPSDVLLTTFSIVMINYQSHGKLAAFRDGIRRLKSLKRGDRVLIAEACNHTRMQEDIGTVQIPKVIEERFPEVVVEHSFGREFSETSEIGAYDLVIHCGGCMIDSGKLAARIRDLDALGVPYTNYGLFLSWKGGEKLLERVLKPWGLDLI